MNGSKPKTFKFRGFDGSSIELSIADCPNAPFALVPHDHLAIKVNGEPRGFLHIDDGSIFFFQRDVTTDNHLSCPPTYIWGESNKAK